MKQTSFNFKINCKKAFGGRLLEGIRKSARPLSTRQTMHFVLKSAKARGGLSFVNHRHHMEKIIAQVSKNFHVKLYRIAVNFDHIHIVLLLSNRYSYKPWIRALTSMIVQLLSSRTKTRLHDFFTPRPHSTIVAWGRQFKTLLEYMNKNERELFGIFRPQKKINTIQFKILTKQAGFRGLGRAQRPIAWTHGHRKKPNPPPRLQTKENSCKPPIFHHSPNSVEVLTGEFLKFVETIFTNFSK